MSRLVTSGFETQRLTTSSATCGEGQGIAISGVVTVDLTTPRSGLACAQAGPSGENKIDLNIAGVLGRTYYLRQAARFSGGLPDANLNFMQVWSSGGGTLLQVLLSPTGEITIWNNKAGVTLENTTFFPDADTYYLYELKVMVPSAGLEGAVQLTIRDDAGEVVFGSSEYTTNLGNSAISAFTLGHLTGSESLVTVKVDDIALNDDQGEHQNLFPEDGKVVLMRSKAEPDEVSVGFLNGAGGTTNLWKALDNFPPVGVANASKTAESQIYSANSNSTDSYEGEVGKYSDPISVGGAGITSADTIKTVMGIARGSNSGATARNLRMWVGSNPFIAKATKATSGAAGTEPTGWTTITTTTVYPDPGDIDINMETWPLVEKGTASTDAMAYDMIGVYVEYEPGGIEEFVFSPSGSSASLGSSAESFEVVDLVSGSSASSGSHSESLTFFEDLTGGSESSGEVAASFEESIFMTLEGSSISTGESTDDSESFESPIGISISIGSESDTLQISELTTGFSESSGSQNQQTGHVESLGGSALSSGSELDEFITSEMPSASSASSGAGTTDEFTANDAVSGSSNSSGSSITKVEVEEPVPPDISPVKPRRRLSSVRWRFYLCDSESMELLDEIDQARNRQLQLALDKSGGCNFSVPLGYDKFKDVEEINHGIVAYRDKVPRYSGMIWNIDEKTTGNSIGVQSVGWFETLNHRLLREDVGYPPFNTGVVNAGQILFMPAQGSVGTTSYHPGGLLTIANAQRDTWIVEGSNKDKMQRIISYQKGQGIGEAISQLSEIEAGFDFWVDPLTRVMDITNWDEVPDKTEEIIFGYNWGPSNIKDLGRQFDASVMANRVTALGKYGGGFAEDIESQEKYQLFEEMPQLNDVVDPNVLLGYAGGEVLLRNRPRVLYSFEPFPYSAGTNIPQPFDDYDIGDMIAFTAIKPPRIEIRSQSVRVFGMNIDITDEGNEKVTALQISP